MAWQYDKKVLATFTYTGAQWAWANIETLGWKRIKDGAPDGVTNLQVLLDSACANARLVPRRRRRVGPRSRRPISI